MTKEKESQDIKKTEETKTTYKYAKTKKRNWVFVLYPESAPSDWREKLQSTGLEVAISPLHDKDKNPTGEVKKAHYHIILCYNNTVTGRMVKAFVDELNQPMPLPLDSVKGMYRYFTHKDNPEKYQYHEKDITTINGFNISNYADLSSADASKIKLELTKYIKESDLLEYSDFVDAVMELEKPDYFYIASTNTVFFNAYLNSRRHSLTRGKNVIICDKDSGEILAETDNKKSIKLEP